MESRKYELFLVLPGTLNDNESTARVNEVLKSIEPLTTGAELHVLGKNRLAYPIKQIRYGYYYTIVFSATPESVRAIEDKMRLTRDILRHMVTYFNTTLTAEQRLAYTTEGMGVVVNQADRQPEEKPVLANVMAKLLNEDVPAEKVAKSAVERKIDNTDLASINKKLDDLMSGDVIPSV